MDTVCGVILSGGESRRYGKPKAFEMYNGQPFWKYSLEAVEKVTDQQVIVSHEKLLERFKEVIHDSTLLILDDELVKGNGPMAGLFSAMKKVHAEWYVLLSCDIPKIKQDTISLLLSLIRKGDDAVIPIINDRIQPLVGVYHHSVLEKIENQLRQKKFKMMALLEQINVNYVTAEMLQHDIESFQNINDHQDFEILVQNEKK